MIATSYWPCVLPILKTRWFIYWWLVNILFFSIFSCPCSHIWWWNINKYLIKKSTSHRNLFALLFDDEITESFSNKQIRQNHLNIFSPSLMMKYQKVFQTNKLDKIIFTPFFPVWWWNIKKYFRQTKSTNHIFLFASLFDEEISKSIS